MACLRKDSLRIDIFDIYNVDSTIRSIVYYHNVNQSITVKISKDFKKIAMCAQSQNYILETDEAGNHS